MINPGLAGIFLWEFLSIPKSSPLTDQALPLTYLLFTRAVFAAIFAS